MQRTMDHPGLQALERHQQKMRDERTDWARSAMDNQSLRERLTTKQEQVLECVALGMTDKEIQEKLSCSEVCNFIAKIKVKEKTPRREPKARTATRAKYDEEKQESIRLRREEVKIHHSRGLTLYEITKVMEGNYSTTRNDLRALNLSPNKPVGNPYHSFSNTEARRICNETEKSVIRRRLARGMTVGNMAVQDGVGRRAVLFTMHRLGFDIPANEAWYSTSTNPRVAFTPQGMVWTGRDSANWHGDTRGNMS